MPKKRMMTSKLNTHYVTTKQKTRKFKKKTKRVGQPSFRSRSMATELLTHSTSNDPNYAIRSYMENLQSSEIKLKAGRHRDFSQHRAVSKHKQLRTPLTGTFGAMDLRSLTLRQHLNRDTTSEINHSISSRMFGGYTNRIINAIKSSTQNNNVIREPTPSNNVIREPPPPPQVKAKAVSTSTTQTRDDNEIVSAGSGSGFANVSRTPLRVESHSQITTPHRSPDANPTTAPNITPAANPTTATNIITQDDNEIITPLNAAAIIMARRQLNARRLHQPEVMSRRGDVYSV